MMQGELTPEAKEARRKYHRDWAAKNPEKVRESARRYWERKAHAENKGRDYVEKAQC